MIEIRLNGMYDTVEGIKLMCYDESRDFYYLCPFEDIGEDEYELNLNNVYVYSKDELSYPVSYICKKFLVEGN